MHSLLHPNCLRYFQKSMSHGMYVPMHFDILNNTCPCCWLNSNQIALRLDKKCILYYIPTVYGTCNDEFQRQKSVRHDVCAPMQVWKIGQTGRSLLVQVIYISHNLLTKKALTKNKQRKKTHKQRCRYCRKNLGKKLIF